MVEQHTLSGKASSSPAGAFFCTSFGTAESPVAWLISLEADILDV
jgi:hypothetical protein